MQSETVDESKLPRPSVSINPSPIYSLGLIGAAVHYLQHASSLEVVVLGLLKAVVWPAFIVYEALRALN
jgi:hypothetical protein